MRHFLAGILLATALVAASTCRAGEIVAFQEGEPKRVALPNVALKAVVAELLDPSDTGDGKAVAYLLWREILSAISDQSGAGVILARPPGDKRIVDMLADTYHHAALEIAEGQQARMALWGAVARQGDQLSVDLYLTLVAGEAAGSLRLMAEPSHGAGLEATIPRTRFNFAPVATARSNLFARTVITRQATTLRHEPRADAAAVQNVAAGTALAATDMRGQWFVIRQPNGQSAYLNAESVDVPPREVEAAGAKIKLWSAPNTKAPVSATRTLNGAFIVTDMRYIASQGLWYHIAVDGEAFWVQATQVHPRFALPAVHFVAGLYRFYAKRYTDAVGEFRQFLAAPGVTESNVNQATAYQFLGASQVMGHLVFGLDPSALGAFDSAVALTPYDPDAYTLRAVAGFGFRRPPQAALTDLAHALTLDRESGQAHRLLKSIDTVATAPGEDTLRSWTKLDTVKPAIADLRQRYCRASASDNC